MLLTLTVENLALIDHEEISFGPGLNILTGETGAGKSILLGALGLALGQKASRDMLRDPEKDGRAEAVFSVLRPSEKEAFRSLGIEPYDDEVILSRRITGNRTVAKINGETVPSVRLKDAGALLLDIYGQKEHQTLLSRKKHRELLDDFAESRDASFHDLKEKVRKNFEDYRKKKEELQKSSADDSERAREASFLTHEIGEIEDANLQPGEDEALEEKYRRMKNREKIAEALNQIEEMTSGDEGASDLAGRSLSLMNGISSLDSEGLSGLSETLGTIDGLLSDFSRDLADYRESMEFDPEDFQETEERLDLVNDLKNRYGNTIEAILSALEKKKDRLEQLEHYDEYMDELKRETKELEEALARSSEELSAARKTAAVTLTSEVADALRDLNFLDVRFEMRFDRTSSYTAEGIDDPEFMIALNPGEMLRPLQETASGGELSRIMLAIKTVFAEEDDIDTLIFDEIDTGISGRTAQKVSEKLARVALHHQVICITHLPQIASMADSHFLVEKTVQDGRTISTMRPLDEEGSARELARMLGGSEITATVMDSAREMKELARRKKASWKETKES